MSKKTKSYAKRCAEGTRSFREIEYNRIYRVMIYIGPHPLVKPPAAQQKVFHEGPKKATRLDRCTIKRLSEMDGPASIKSPLVSFEDGEPRRRDDEQLQGGLVVPH